MELLPVFDGVEVKKNLIDKEKNLEIKNEKILEDSKMRIVHLTFKA
jgi:hypothetical protein